MSVESKTIQDKVDELNKLVEWFDGDEFTLEAALDKYKDAEKLAADIENELLNLKNEVNVIKQEFDSEK